MVAMQKLQPEMKKLQQKYKGPENRQLLNEEMMKLYNEEGVNPLGGCLPMLLQTPFLIMLYSVIKGFANKVMKAGKMVSQPRYIPTGLQDVPQPRPLRWPDQAFGAWTSDLKLFYQRSQFVSQRSRSSSSWRPPWDFSTSRWRRSTTAAGRPVRRCRASSRPCSGSAAYFRILLHGHPCSRCVVHDYFNSHPYNNSIHHVPNRAVEPGRMARRPDTRGDRRKITTRRAKSRRPRTQTFKPKPANRRPSSLDRRIDRRPNPSTPSRKQQSRSKAKRKRKAR